MKAYSPKGALIVGIAESVLVTAWLDAESLERRADGTIAYEHAGESKIHWDTQEACAGPDGKVRFEDENGEEWTQDQITFEKPVAANG